MGSKWFVVVDGKEGKQYDAAVTVGAGRIIFDFPVGLHYLAQEGDKIYLERRHGDVEIELQSA